MELFSKPSANSLSSCNDKPCQFSRRAVSLGPSEMVGEGGVARDRHPLTEGVVIDDVTRLERCPLTGDWRFVTISQDASMKLKGNNCNGSTVTVPADPPPVGQPLCLPQVRSGSADPKHGPRRRRRYGSLKLEDMGIKIPDETILCLNTDETVKDGDTNSPVVTPIEFCSTNPRRSLPTTPRGVDRDSKNQLLLSPAPLQAQRSLDYYDPGNVMQTSRRRAPSSTIFRDNNGLLSERSDSTAISASSPNKSNEDSSSIISSSSRPYLAAECMAKISKNSSSDAFMGNNSRRSTELSVLNSSSVVEVGRKHITAEVDSNTKIVGKESQRNLNDKDLRSISNTDFAVSEDSAAGFSNVSCSQMCSVGTVPVCNKTLDVVCDYGSQDTVQMSSRSDQSESKKVMDIGYSMPSDTTSFLDVSNVTDSSALQMTSKIKNILNVKNFLFKSDQDEAQGSFAEESQHSALSDSTGFITSFVSKKTKDISLQNYKCPSALKESCDALNFPKVLLETSTEQLSAVGKNSDNSLRSNVSVANPADFCSLDALADHEEALQEEDSAVSKRETTVLSPYISCDGRSIQCIKLCSVARHPSEAEESGMDERRMGEKDLYCLSVASTDDDGGGDKKDAENEAICGNICNTECNIQLTLSCENRKESTVEERNVPSDREAFAYSDRKNVLFLNQNDEQTGYEGKIKAAVERPNSLMIDSATIGKEKCLSVEMASNCSSPNRSNKTLHRSFPCHDIARLAGNNFSCETSERKALFSSSSENEESSTLVKGNATPLSLAEKVKGKVDLPENFVDNAENIMDFTENGKYEAVLAENANSKAVGQQLHVATASVNSSDDSDKLRIPQFVSCGFSGDLTSQQQQQQKSFVSSPSKPNRDVFSDSFPDSFVTQDGQSNISLLSWLQQSSLSSGSPSHNARTCQSSSSMIPVAVLQRRTGLPGNQAPVEIGKRAKLSDSGLMSEGFKNSAAVVEENGSLLFKAGVAISKGNLFMDLSFSCGRSLFIALSVSLDGAIVFDLYAVYP